jgi:hypothetical protein
MPGTKESVAQLETYFQTGDYPTQQQFWNLLASFIHKDDGVAIVDVSGLTAALNLKADKNAVDTLTPKVISGATASWLVPAGTTILGILITNPTTINFKIGKTAGAEDVMAEIPVDGGYATNQFMFHFPVDTTIYFTGNTASSIIKIFKA